MKNLLNYKTLLILFTAIFIIPVFCQTGFAKDPSGNKSNSSGKKVAEVINKKKLNFDFKTVSLFSFEKNVYENDNTNSFVKNASLISLKSESLRKILRSEEENIVFKIPVSSNEFIELELTRSYPTADNILLISIDANGKKTEPYKQGLHYNGIIKGKNNSIAAVSIFENFVLGVISDENGNYNLGSIKNNDNSYSQNYIFYNDADLNIKNNFKCGIEDNENKFTLALKNAENYSRNIDPIDQTDNSSVLPVKVYFEADYKTYIDGQQNSSAVFDFIIAMYNSVKTIYQNESIPTVISSIAVWTVPDPYSNLTNSIDILKGFGQYNKDDFQGNLAHLVSTRPEGFGGIAWVRTLCANYDPQSNSGRYAFSNIDPSYNNYPTYSWTVNVVAHEMGHNMGSLHTQSCIWPIGGTFKTIDSCYTPEGNCNYNPHPSIGTIMSYCHLWIGSGGGVNLSLGFGPLPGDTIRLRYSQASCLAAALNSSEAPASFDLDQNFPNPFNPSTTFRFALPKESFVDLKIYDINGREVASIIKNKYYDKGFYEQSFNFSQYSLSSGIYFYTLTTEDFKQTKRLILLK